MKITIYSHHEFEKKFIEKAKVYGYEIVRTSENLSTKNTELAKGSHAVLVFSSDNVSKDVILPIEGYRNSTSSNTFCRYRPYTS